MKKKLKDALFRITSAVALGIGLWVILTIIGVFR